jgi:uncharacterized membrane protein YphA (DoxX/SURF4 family)
MVAKIRRDDMLRAASMPAALCIAYILLSYEQYKLTGNAGSVWLFTVLSDWIGLHGYEAPFRWSVGLAEIAASLLVLVPATRMLGALLALGIMSGAIFFHLASPLGIDPYGDGARLFKEACGVWLAAALILAARRDELRPLIRRLRMFEFVPFRRVPG